MKKFDRPPLVSDEMFIKTKTIASYLRIQRAAIKQKEFIAVGKGVLSALLPENKAKTNSSIALSRQWTRDFFKLLEQLKWKETDAKKMKNLALYDDFAFLQKTKIAQIVLEHNNYKK